MVQNTTDYTQLVQRIGKIFKLSQSDKLVGSAIKLYYMDCDGDVISVTSQDDLAECDLTLNNRFALCNSVDSARDILSKARTAASEALNQSQSLNQSFASINEHGAQSARGYGQLGAVGMTAYPSYDVLADHHQLGLHGGSLTQRQFTLPISGRLNGAYAQQPRRLTTDSQTSHFDRKMTDYEL